MAGVDEVGRGSFAGPVVTGCVVFGLQGDTLQIEHTIDGLQGDTLQGDRKIRIDDSKKLSAKQRELADRWIRKNAVACGLGQASVSQINRLGIKKATEIAFRKAIVATNKNLEFRILNVGQKQDSIFQIRNSSIDYLLIDAFYIPYVVGLRHKNQEAIVKGDTKSISIAAASIIAKVYRDKLMTNLSNNSRYKKYKWHKNKGYGTKEHRDAIKRYGVTKLHRKQFVRNCVSSPAE